MEGLIFTQEQAQQSLLEWQKILRLQDWQIKIKIARDREFLTEGMAEVVWLREKKQAMVKLLDPLDFASDIIYPQDHELSIVHELLHLHMVDFDQEVGTLENIAQEQAIHAISTALVTLKRGDAQ